MRQNYRYAHANRRHRSGNGTIMKTIPCFLLLSILVGITCAEDKKNGAIIPVPRFENATWTSRHAAFVEQAGAGDIDLLFLGDSLTAKWELYPDLWKEKFGCYKSAEFGIGGDQTEHLLWRLQNGELDGKISPKLIVLLIGANNMSKSLKYTPQNIADGVAANICEIRKRQPQSKIILMSILPRVVAMDDWLNLKNIEVNKLLPALADGENVIYLNMWPLLLEPDGTASAGCFSDNTHLNAAGYIRLADAVLPVIREHIAD